MDCSVASGYIKTDRANLPDIDLDFGSENRQQIKAYLEERYDKPGQRRVFSAGTFTTQKIKSAVKDVARTHKVSVGSTNYFNGILDDSMTFTDVMVQAFENKKVKDYVEKNPEVFEEILPIFNQPRSAGIHASAVITAPETLNGEKLDCFSIIPMRKMDGLIVSELSGNDVDSIGLLKSDILGIAELERFQAMLKAIKENYCVSLTLEDILNKDLNEPGIYKMIQDGITQGLFQMSGDGITRFMKKMRPDNINDLIAAIALFRPGALDSGAAEGYCDAKKGLVVPEYLWNTYDSLHNTFSFFVFQEQVAEVARTIGNLSLADGVKLVKALSKKKVDKVRKFKDKYFDGANKNGCPKEAANKIWDDIESGAKYLFNKCISGKETIFRPSGNRNTPTIGEMYKIMHSCRWAKNNNRMPLRGRYLKLGYGKSWSMDENNLLKVNSIVDIRYSGKRPLYRITLENGSHIDVTANHKHPTLNGDKRTDELIVGEDKMFCYNGWKKEDTGYRFTDKGELNNTRYHSNDNVVHYELNSRKGHLGFYKRETEYTKLEYYRKHLMKDYCEKCGKTDVRLEIHHIDGDHSNCGENYSNLATLCVSCHKKVHYEMGRAKFGEKGITTKAYTVVSVEYIGIDDVYDVEMAAPYHNFTIANGIITCNSHATAYGLTGFISAWIKYHYPVAFFSEILKWVDEKKLPIVMNEMRDMGTAKIVQTDINISGVDFVTDYKNNTIYWSLSRIKYLGLKAVQAILRERDMFGKFDGLEDFIQRIFRKEGETNRSVTSRSVKQLIFAGAFDTIEGIRSQTERFGLLQKASELLGFEISEDELPIDKRGKHYYWSKKQIEVSGMGSVDYRRIYDGLEGKLGYVPYKNLDELMKIDMNMGNWKPMQKFAFCATISEVTEKRYDAHDGTKKRFGKVMLLQNTDVMQLTIWNDAWEEMKDNFVAGRIIAGNARVKYSDYDGCNTLQMDKNFYVRVI